MKLAQTIHEHLLQQPILSPGAAFSLGLLDGRHGDRIKEPAGSRRHGPLTTLEASIHVARLIRCVVDLAGAHDMASLSIAPCALREAYGKERGHWTKACLGRAGWAGEITLGAKNTKEWATLTAWYYYG